MIFRKVALLIISGGIFLAAAAPSPAWAAKWHHVHLTASDTPEAAQWYAKYLEGAAIKNGPFDIAAFGETLVIFFPNKNEFEGSVGSSVDHIGWSFPDLDAKMKEFEEAGIKIVAPAIKLGKLKFGFIEDPWGTKIEVMEDPELIGFHHIHLLVPDTTASQNWYSKAFGGEVTKFGGFLPAVKYENMWLIIQRGKDKAPTKGRSVDHISWSFPDLDAGIANLAEMGTTLESGPMALPLPDGTKLKIAFLIDPDGVRIEIVEAPEAPAEADSGSE